MAGSPMPGSPASPAGASRPVPCPRVPSARLVGRRAPARTLAPPGAGASPPMPGSAGPGLRRPPFGTSGRSAFTVAFSVSKYVGRIFPHFAAHFGFLGTYSRRK